WREPSQLESNHKKANQGTTPQFAHTPFSPLQSKLSESKTCAGSGPLLHCRIIGGTHVHFVHLILFVHLFYDRDGLVPILRKCRVGMERGPILFRFFLTGMSHEVDERMGPSRIIIGHPVADDLEIVLLL